MQREGPLYALAVRDSADGETRRYAGSPLLYDDTLEGLKAKLILFPDLYPDLYRISDFKRRYLFLQVIFFHDRALVHHFFSFSRLGGIVNFLYISGRLDLVLFIAISLLPTSILLLSPDNRTPGTLRPLNSAGLVYWGYSKSPDANDSNSSESLSPTTPGTSLTRLSTRAIAGISPPVKTKSPSDISSVTSFLRNRSSIPS